MFKRLAIVCVVALLTACSTSPPDESPEENVVIASEKTAPENFEDLAIDGTYNAYYAQKAENVEQFQSLWSTFRMKGELPKIDFETKVAYFISFYESSSCPKEPKNVDVRESTFSFSLEVAGEENLDCTADESQRTLILEIDSSEVNSVLIREGEAETEVPLR